MKTATKRNRTGENPPSLSNGPVTIRLTNGQWIGYVNGKRVADFYWAGRVAQLDAAIQWLEDAAMVA